MNKIESDLFKDLKNNFAELKSTPNSDISLKLRKRVFIEDQTFNIIFQWFDMFYDSVPLTTDELKITSKLISTFDDYQEELIFKVLKYQPLLNIDQVKSFVNILDKEKRTLLYPIIIKDKRIKDDQYKISLFKYLIKDAEYTLYAIDLLDEEIDEAPLWKEMLKIVVDIINEGGKYSEKMAEYWADTSIYHSLTKCTNCA